MGSVVDACIMTKWNWRAWNGTIINYADWGLQIKILGAITDSATTLRMGYKTNNAASGVRRIFCLYPVVTFWGHYSQIKSNKLSNNFGGQWQHGEQLPRDPS